MTTCSACGREFATTRLKNGRPHKCCPACRDEAKERRAQARLTDPEGNARYHRQMRRRYREDAFRAYGGACACCGESYYEFLVIDHPDGGGRRERAENFAPGGSTFAQWLAKQGYPPGYRVLCHNCNSAYGYYGQCPHNATSPEAAEAN